jgi:hypothetical protein
MRLKPSSPRLRRDHPLAANCEAFWPFIETGGDAIDVIDGIRLSPQTNAGRTASPLGLSGNCNSAQVGFSGTATPRLRLQLPISIACVVHHISTPSVNGSFFGVTFNNADTSPFYSYAIDNDSAGNLRIGGNDAGSYYQTTSTVAVSSLIGSLSRYVAVFTSSRRTLFRNGIQVITEASTRSSPTYGAAAQVVAGFYPAVSRNSSVQFIGGGIWSSALSTEQISQFSDDPFAMLRPRQRSYFVMAGGAPATPSGSGTVSGVGTLTGTGSTAKSGSGSVIGVGTLAGNGFRPPEPPPGEGSGVVDSIGTLTGTGLSVRSGSGSVSGVGVLSGTGETPTIAATGSGIVSGVGELLGTGLSVRSGSGFVSGVGVISGVGFAPIVGVSSGFGQVVGVGEIIGAGSVVRSGGGSVTAVGELVGVGPIVVSDAYFYYYWMR